MTVVKAVSIPESALMLGVGGMGMAPLAIFLAQAGCQVHGWDDRMQAPVRALLEAHGVQIMAKAPVCATAEAVIFSSAIQGGHPVLESARAEGRTVMRRGEMLARLAEDFRLVAVAGSHGKTTTTGLLIHALRQHGFAFNYVLGARFRKDVLAPAHFEPGTEWLVAEVDESDGTIEGFSPEITVFVNFDWDHADRYSSASELDSTFVRLAERTRSVVLTPECHVMRLPQGLRAELVPVSVEQGDFNRANAALAHAAAQAMSGESVTLSLEDFPGIARRQDVLYQDGNTVVLADYAHHPTEIAALLKHARGRWPGRVVAVFQPHRYSRTAIFAASFAEVLSPADAVFLLPVYAASESRREDGLSAAILEHAGAHWHEATEHTLASALGQCLSEPGPTTLLFIGAGDIDVMATDFVNDWSMRRQLFAGVSGDTTLKLAEPLARRTTLRVGGPARFFAEPATTEDLQALLVNASAVALPFFFLGRGSNLIVSDKGFEGLVIALTADHWRSVELLDGGRLRVGAGLRLKELCGFAARHGLGGLEFLEGIPGTVGGSLRMNAGAMGGWIFDVVESVRFITPDGVLHNWGKAQFHVGYRHCAELREAIAIEVVMVSGQMSQTDAVRHTMDTYAAKRKESQPREPSAGCIFKNPEGNFAGKLVDELGLKGLSCGAAEVSAVHGNFIINRGGATCADILALVREVRERIHQARGIWLEPEVLLLGDTWEEVLR